MLTNKVDRLGILKLFRSNKFDNIRKAIAAAENKNMSNKTFSLERKKQNMAEIPIIENAFDMALRRSPDCKFLVTIGILLKIRQKHYLDSVLQDNKFIRFPESKESLEILKHEIKRQKELPGMQYVLSTRDEKQEIVL